MMKAFWLVILSFFCCLSYVHSEKILMRIGEEEVLLSEFELYYRQFVDNGGEKNPQLYLRDFLDFKLKAADAKKQRWDTLTLFRQQCAILQGRIFKEICMDSLNMYRACHDFHLQKKNRLETRSWVKMEYITIPLSPNASDKEEYTADSIINSIYRQLEQGADFSGFAGQYTVPTMNNGGKEWLPMVGMLQEFAGHLSKLRRGEFSRPFYSPLGVHIVKLVDRKECMEDIFPSMTKCPRDWESQLSLLNDLDIRWFSRQELPSTVKLRLKQVYDGLLVAYWDQEQEERSLNRFSSDELKTYFKSHKSRYAWEFPHFKGGVIHCLNKKAASKIKKRLKKCSQLEWQKEIRKLEEANPELHAEIESGLFQIGKNPYVDKLVFKCGSFVAKPDLPYTFVIGEKMDKGPKHYQDVLEQVVSDYRLEQEKNIISSLRQYFTVEINQDVLKTVNCCGNN